MRMNKLRLYMAGFIAFLIGMPLTEKAFGQPGSIEQEALDLANAITNLSPGGS